MATARWSLRLPRAASLAYSIERRAPQRIVRIDQRRWLPRSRPWASIPKKGGPENEGHQNLINEGERQRSEAQEEQPGRNSQLAATLAESDSSDLVTEVRIPDDPNGVLPPDHPARSILGNSSLVIQRQLEMMNVVMGFEQANKYIIMDGQGNTLGYIAEQDHGIGKAMLRQLAKTHRSFTTHIFDRNEKEVLRIHRPFAYINSRIRIYDPIPEGGYGDGETSTALQGTSTSSVTNQGAVAQISPLKLDEMRIIGEAQQQWAPLRRKYNLFSYRAIEPARDDTLKIESGEQPSSDTKALTEAKAPDAAIEAGMAQFAHVNEPFLSWDFTLRGEDGNVIGSVNRNFGGFAREIFTDTGVYALRMDSAAQSSALETAAGQEVARYERDATAMTLDQRAVMLATAVSIDFDYFSRHSHVGGGGFMPIFWPMGGGAAEGGAAGAGAGAAGGAVGAAEGAGAIEGAAGAAGAAGRGIGGAAGVGEGAMAGAGTMAGYEAMQRGVYGPRGGDDASPTNNEPFAGDGGQSPQQGVDQPGSGDVWGESSDPWGRGGPGDGPPPSAGGEGGGGEGGGGWMDAISDFFGD
ncbi:hypothetical protein PRZ48_007580 [Zasmidium cellare]|uniref:Scramblase-domain-containing protein n=1 Tax=Zasmidium cellare TaxID=395010 RepID=A0ABR0EKS9_ZASCE|nr:hypothetical protein PRZ48_007580 [Zasmidium cellare]